MKTFVLCLLFFCLAVPMKAQTSNKFTLSGNALGYLSGGAKLPAADAIGVIQINPTFAVRTDNIIVSTLTQNSTLAAFDLGGLQYNLPASKLFTSLKLDPSSYDAYAIAETGTITSSLGTSASYSAGFGVDKKMSSSVSLTLFEARWLHGAVPSGSNPVNDALAISFGVSFGK